MKMSTPETPNATQNRSILLIGPPGGGKSTLMLQFPGLAVMDCDRNLKGPEDWIRAKNPKFAYMYETIALDDDGISMVPIEKCFDRLISKLTEVAKHPDVKVVGVDSLTWVNEYIIRKVLKEQGGEKEEMEARNWIPFKSQFLKLLSSKLRGTNKHIVCTVHETMVWETDPKNIMKREVKMYEPSVQGSVCDFLGAFFTDVWRCDARPAAGGKVKFTVNPIRTTKSDLKNSCGMTEELENPTFDTVNKYLKL